MKVIRSLLVLRQGTREVTRLIHPNAEVAVKRGDKPVGPRIVEAVWGFFAVYLVVFTLLMLALMGTGVEQITAFCTIAMLLGRLEIFTLLILFTVTFWRK